MERITASTIFLICGLMTSSVTILVYKRNYDIMVNKTIKISRKYKFNLGFDDPGQRISFINEKKEITYIKGAQRKLLHWFIIGEIGYYVVNRISGEMFFSESYEVIPKKYKYKFDKIDCNNIKSIL